MNKAILALLALILVASIAKAETYTINGSANQTKLKAIVALASNKDAKVERCAYKEVPDQATGKILCRPVELSPRGTIRLQK